MTVNTTHQVKEPQPAPAAATGNADEVVHIVSWWQWFLDVVLRLKVPRALCGVKPRGRPRPARSHGRWRAPVHTVRRAQRHHTRRGRPVQPRKAQAMTQRNTVRTGHLGEQR